MVAAGVAPNAAVFGSTLTLGEAACFIFALHTSALESPGSVIITRKRIYTPSFAFSFLGLFRAARAVVELS